MTDEELQNFMINMFEEQEFMDSDERGYIEELHGCRARSYEERGVMTYDKGIVLRTEDGSEFQITIIKVSIH